MKSGESTSRSEFDTTNFFDSNEELKSIDSIRNPSLDKCDIEEIENEIIQASAYFKAILEDKDIENHGLGIPFLFSVFFIVFLLQIFRVSYLYSVKSTTSSLMSTDETGFEIKTIEDIDLYIRDKVFNTFQSESTNQFYISTVGLKLALRKSKIIKNPYFEYPEYVSEYQGEANGRTSKFGIWDYGSKEEAFPEYFTGLSLNDSLVKWRQMKPFWLDIETFISLDIQLVTHCRNTLTTSYFLKRITFKSSGKFEFEEFCQGFSPEIYSYSGEKFTSIIIIFTFLTILYIIQLVKFLRTYWLICKRLITKFELKLNLYDYLELFFMCCVTITFALFIKLNLALSSDYFLPLSNNRLDGLIDHLSEYRDFTRTSSLACLFSIFRLVALMKIQFPSFGVLFETIKLSKNDIVNICFISSILFCGFFISAHVAYGVHAERFSTLSIASIEYFKTMTGNIEFNYCEESSCTVITLISMLFVIVFYFILTNLLYAVIISTFYFIKTQDRLLIAAKTELILGRTKELLKIIIGFLKFDNRSQIYKDVEEYIKLSEENSICNENREKIKNIESFIKGQMNISFIQKFKLNLSSLKTFLYESNLVNQEEYIENFKKKIRKILTKEKVDIKIQQLREFDVDYNFRIIRGLFCYILLIVFFLYTVISFLSIKNSYEIRKINNDCTIDTIFKYSSSENLGEINNIFNMTEELVTSLLTSHCNSQNFLYLNNTFQITAQFYTQLNNTNHFSKSIFPEYTTGSLNFSAFRGKNTNLFYNQYPEGNQNTYKLGGGLSYTFNDLGYAQSLFGLMKLDDILNNCKLFAIEWVTTNPNLNYITYNSVLFTIGIDQFMKADIDSVPIGPFFHTNDNDPITACSLISLVLCCYFFITNLIDIGQLWRSLNLEILEDERKKYKLNQIIDKICGSKQNDLNSHVDAYYFSKIKKTMKNIFKYSFQFAKLIFIYFFTVPFNLLEAISIVLTFVTLINILYANFYIFEINNVNDASFVADYINYIKTLAGLNSMILLIQLPSYLQIFSQISYLISIIMSARLDFIFFMIMYFIILFSYVFSGYILLGNFHSGYSMIQLSLFSTYFMQFGEYNQEDYSRADRVLGILYIFLYILIFVFFLTTMFTAIFSGNYVEDIHIYKMSTFEKVKRTIFSRWEGKKVIFLPTVKEEEQENSIPSIDRIVLSKDDENIYNVEKVYKGNIDEVSYFSALQKHLTLKNIKLTISSIENDFKIKYYNSCLLPYINLHIWKESSKEEKEEIWNALSIQYNDQILSTIDEFPVIKGNQKITKKFSDLQEILWKSLTLQEKIEIWSGNLCNLARVFIWNLEDNQESFFEGWETSKTKERIEKVKKFIQCEGIQQDLWKSLPRYSSIKLNLLLSLKEKLQTEWVMYLCILDAVDSPIFIEMIDEKLEEILNNAIYTANFKICEYQGEKRKFEKITELKISALTECTSLTDYKSYVHSKLKQKLKKNSYRKKINR